MINLKKCALVYIYYFVFLHNKYLKQPFIQGPKSNILGMVLKKEEAASSILNAGEQLE